MTKSIDDGPDKTVHAIRPAGRHFGPLRSIHSIGRDARPDRNAQDHLIMNDYAAHDLIFGGSLRCHAEQGGNQAEKCQ